MRVSEPTHTTPVRCWSSASLSVTGSPSTASSTPGCRKSSVTPNGSSHYCWWAHRSTWGPPPPLLPPPPPLLPAPPRTRCRRRKAATWQRSSGLTATSSARRGVRKVSSRSSSTSSSPLSSTARRRAGSSTVCSETWLYPILWRTSPVLHDFSKQPAYPAADSMESTVQTPLKLHFLYLFGYSFRYPFRVLSNALWVLFENRFTGFNSCYMW